LLEKLAAAFEEIEDSGGGILAWSDEAALDLTLVVWVCFAYGKPVLDVVADAHLDGVDNGVRG
jgi:hypothetical protein